MFSFKSIVLIAAAFAVGAESSAVAAVAAAPLVASAHVGYAHTVPQNIPPYASQINVVSKALSPYVVATRFAAPLAAPLAAPYAAAPYVAAPAPYALPAAAAYAAAPLPYAAAAHFPYAAAAPLVRAPFGVAPAFVR